MALCARLESEVWAAEGRLGPESTELREENMERGRGGESSDTSSEQTDPI